MFLAAFFFNLASSAMAQATADFSGMTDQVNWLPVFINVILIGGGLAGVYLIVKCVDILIYYVLNQR
ncbi:MAG: hypothetical protein FWF12_04045 [Betaproteobacteria bacterium]|nr:hypothetical protein [Betaproteobacteria bacterium]